ncbi:MAG: AI-2E family transporter [Anaerovoracaceae bacterium]|jgi:predicted PurR-regulated permease PerM
MSKIKETLSDSKYLRFCIYLASAAIILYSLYFAIKNIDVIIPVITGAISHILKALSPLFIGLTIAYLISPLVEIIQQKIINKLFFKLPEDPVKAEKKLQLRRTVSVVIAFLILFLIICTIIYSFAILIVGQLVFDNLTTTFDNVKAHLLEYENDLRAWVASIPGSGLEARLQEGISLAMNWLADNFNFTSGIKALSSLGGSILNMLLGIVVSLYLLKDRDFFIRLWRKFLHTCIPMKQSAIITGTLHDIDSILSRFLRGQLLDALIVAILSSIALTAMGLQFSVFIGCFAGIANIIPYFGPLMGMIPAAIVGIMTDGITHGLLAVALLFIVQQIDSNLIYPKVVGSNTGLHPVFILLAVTFGGYFRGILGMLLAVPIAAIIKLFIVKKLGTLGDDQG